jgi:MFS family permease
LSATEAANSRWLVAFVLIGQCGLSIVFGLLAPLLGPIAHSFGGVAIAQRIIVGPQLGLAVGGVLAGSVLKALGARPTVVISCILFCLAAASGLYIQNASVMLADTYVLGGATVIWATACNLVVAESYSGAGRGRIVGYQTALGSLSQFGGVFLSGLIAQWVGWRYSFLLLVAAGLATLVVGGLGVPPGRPPREPGRAPDLRAFLPVLPNYLTIAATLLVATTTFTHMSLLLNAQGVASPAIAAALIASQSGAAMVAAALYGAMVAWIGRTWTVVFGIGCGAAGMILTGLAPSLPAFAAGTIGLGITIGISFPFLIADTMRRASVAIRPQAMGFLATAQFVGGFLNPYLVEPVSARLGLHGMYVALGLAGLVLGLAAFVTLAREADQMEAA